MKVIKPGAKKGWWVGLEPLCRNCRAVLKLEEGDHVREFSNECGRMVYFDCPECGKEDRVYYENKP